MQLFTIGINHQTAPIAIREQVAFPADQISVALNDLIGLKTIQEAAILSTCNRTEIYCVTAAPESALNWLAGRHHLNASDLAKFCYQHEGVTAVRHAFRVASGLDSMVLGETQILGQMKDAVREAHSAGTLGSTLQRLFQHTFNAAKTVRTDTDIGANSISMAAASVNLAERIFDDIAEQHVLLIGAGEMISLCAAHFAGRKPKTLTIANRTIARGQALADLYQGHAIALSALPDHLAQFDIVLSCTASTLPIIGKGLMETVIKQRRHRPVFMVDLAVPRDIEPEIGTMPDIYLYTVDDLASLVQAGRSTRQLAISDAERIIETQIAEFTAWQQRRGAVPAIRALRELIERQKKLALDRALKQIHQGEDPERVLSQLANTLTNKFLHAPTQALQQAAQHEHEVLLGLVQRLSGFYDDH